MSFTEEVVAGDVLLDASECIGPAQAEFGVKGVGPTAVTLTDDTFGRHVLYLGGIGTGKTVGITALVRSVREAMGPNDTMVVFDTKGDYHGMFGRHGDAVIAAAPDSTYEGQVSWNFFEEFQDLPVGRDPEDEIFEMCTGLFSQAVAEAGDNKFFAQAARDVFTALVTAVFRKGGDLSNADMRKLTELSLHEMKAMLEPHQDLRGVRHYLVDEESPTAQSALSGMQQVIQESFRSTFGKMGAFSIRRFVRSKGAKALFLEYDIASGGMLAPVFKTMIDVAMKEAMSRQRADGRVFFVLDEFALLPELTHLSNGLNFGRSLGLRFIVGTQNIKQVQAMYGPEMAASVLSAFGTVFAFRLFDGDSRDFVRGRFGQNRKISRLASSVRSNGMQEGLVEGWVVEDWDLSSLGIGMCIAAVPGHPPVRFTFAPPAI